MEEIKKPLLTFKGIIIEKTEEAFTIMFVGYKGEPETYTLKRLDVAEYIDFTSLAIADAIEVKVYQAPIVFQGNSIPKNYLEIKKIDLNVEGNEADGVLALEPTQAINATFGTPEPLQFEPEKSSPGLERLKNRVAPIDNPDADLIHEGYIEDKIWNKKFILFS